MTEPRSKRMLELARALADAEPVDWDRAEENATEEERELVQMMRAIGEQADVHRTLQRRERRGPGAPALRRWGQLELGDKLGEGASAEVYRAHDPQLRRDVALKLFRTSSSPEANPRLLEEGRNLARIRHENVVTVFGADEHHGRVGIWMELVEGRTLNAIVNADGPLGPREASVIGVELCRALAAVHRQGIVHADIKAQNVKREALGRIVLMDFSTSRESESAASRRAGSDPAGTPMYMAPELFRGSAPSVASDVYALGVLLFYLVTGRFPVPAKSIEELEAAHRAGTRRLLRDERPGLPDGFVQTIERALGVDPTERFATVGGFEEALRREDGGADASQNETAGSNAWARAGAIVFGVAAGLTLLGFVTTTAFNLTLGRPEAFASESLGELFVWGLRSMVLPLVQFALAAAVVWLTKLLAAPLVERGLERAGANASRVAGGLFVVGVGAVVAIGFAYRDLILAVTSLVGRYIDPEAIALLRPESVTTYLGYRRALALVVFSLGLGLFLIVRASRRAGSQLPRAAVASVVAVIVAAVLMMTFPWRLLSQNEFEKASIDGETAYIIGENDEDVLLFCPTAAGPKNRIVGQDDPQLERLGWIESVFTTPQ